MRLLAALLLAALLLAGACAAAAAHPHPADLRDAGRVQITELAGDVRRWAPAGADQPVYLTYDDGPDPVQTPRVLDVLKKHHARATFFVVGERAAAHPDIIDRIVAEGHTIANHTWAHRLVPDMTSDEFAESIERTDRELGGRMAPCFRAPEFKLDHKGIAVALRRGLDVIGADANPRDWEQPGSDELADRIVAGAQPGNVIVLHDGIDRLQGQTAVALDKALTRLAGSGLRFEPVCAGPPDSQSVRIDLDRRNGNTWHYTGTVDADRWGGRTVDIKLRIPVDAGHAPVTRWHTYSDVAYLDDAWADPAIDNATIRLTVPPDGTVEASWRLQIDSRSVKLDDDGTILDSTEPVSRRRTVTLRLVP